MNIVVIGGGAAGMMAAIAAANENPKAHVFLLEKNEKLGKKIFITGKGRGNLTNACSTEELFNNVITNSRFLYTALNSFTNKDVMSMMEKGGCRVKVERGDRVFPVSDHAFSITDCLKHYLKKSGVNIAYNQEVLDIETRPVKMDAKQNAKLDARVDAKLDVKLDTNFDAKADSASDSKSDKTNDKYKKKQKKVSSPTVEVANVVTRYDSYKADRVIIATGGLAYPETGSTGDGYKFAREMGISTTECYPSLVHFEVEEDDWFRMRGLKLKNIAISITDEDNKKYYDDFGELHIVNQGISGPVIISASTAVTKYLNAEDRSKRKLLTLHIDLKPALTEKQLDERLRRDLDAAGTKSYQTILQELLPAQLLQSFVERLGRKGVDADAKCSVVTKDMRKQTVMLFKDFSYTLRGTGSFREAIVTQGGVSVKEIEPKTMESKKVKGLYFAGEVLDIDCYTGGFNMQSAFSTGHLAGVSAAKA